MKKIESAQNWASLCGVVFFFSGCTVLPDINSIHGEQETGTPIRTENVGKLIKGKTTKLEVIELFGMPSSSGAGTPGMPNMGGNTLPGAIITSGGDEIYLYKHCKTGKPGGGMQIKTVFSLMTPEKVSIEEKCEELSVLLSKNEIVKAFSYITDDPMNEKVVSNLAKGKSSKIDVIELFGAPSSINISGNDEIYTFKKCITTGESGAFTGSKFGQSCKQLTVMLDKNNGVVKTYSFQPYPQ